jgi:hypothetical protein
MRYPPPSYALQCWYADGRIRVAIPASRPDGQGHVVELDADPDGVKTLLFLLKQRVAVNGSRLGEPGVPTQAMLNALATSIKITTVVKTTHKVEPQKGKKPRPAKQHLTLEDLEL